MMFPDNAVKIELWQSLSWLPAFCGQGLGAWNDSLGTLD
jgi:hypothetical protein